MKNDHHPGGHKLGRHQDPRVPEDLKFWQFWLRKGLWRGLESLGARRLTNWIFPSDTLTAFDVKNHPGVKGLVAFTVDDAFCGLDNPGGEMTSEVRELFLKYNARATFFVTATHALEVHSEPIRRLVLDGHELANHGKEDRPYHRESAADFSADLDETAEVISRFQTHAVPWYRSPHARYSGTMAKVLSERGMTHVMVDTFANDTAIPDPEWIADTVLRNVQDGSILLVHMPERGVREWNFNAIERVLAGLSQLGLRAVTVSELVHAASLEQSVLEYEPTSYTQGQEVQQMGPGAHE